MHRKAPCWHNERLNTSHFLDKNPGLRPIGVGKVLRRITGTVVVMKVVKEDIKKAAGCLQLCAGQEAGCEAAIHAMLKTFKSNETNRGDNNS